MVAVTDNRQLIQNEETQFRSALSEAVFRKFGGVANFLNNRQYQPKEFKVNGQYNNSGITGVDGLHVWQFPAEIIGITLFNVRTGTAGDIEFDIHRLQESGGSISDLGSIFSTTPKINFAAGDNAYFNRDVINAVTTGLTTNITLPVFTRTTFLAGDAMRVDFIQAQAGGENAGCIVHFRPINASDVAP